MRDRIPKYPGRVVLTPVEGVSNTYDLSRADEPLEEGTPLSKSTLLSDSVASLAGLTPESAVPNDVFNYLLQELASLRGRVEGLEVLNGNKTITKLGTYIEGGVGTYKYFIGVPVDTSLCGSTIVYNVDESPGENERLVFSADGTFYLAFQWNPSGTVYESVPELAALYGVSYNELSLGGGVG